MANEFASDLEETYQKRVREMTLERALKTVRAGAEILGDQDYLGAEMELRLIADWMNRQFSPDDKISAVKGAIIGALAGGHIDGRDGASYSKGVLAGIADLLDIAIPDEIKARNGLH